MIFTRKFISFCLLITLCCCSMDTLAQAPQDPLLVRKNGKWGFADRNGRIVIKPQFKHANLFIKGYALVSKDNDNGYLINRDGARVFVPNAAKDYFSEGLMPIKIDDKHGFVDESLQ